MFRKKHDPIVNAILRGVYFKEDPVDLTSGKYENRLVLLKVPRLTKERILKVSPERQNDLRIYSGTVEDADNTSIIIDTADAYNAIFLKLKTSLSKNVVCNLNIKDKNDEYILVASINDNRAPYLNKFFFSTRKYIDIRLYNNGTADLDYEIILFYSQDIKKNIFTNKGTIASSETLTFYFRDVDLLNRLSYIFYNAAAAQDYTIKAYGTLHSDAIPQVALYSKLLDENIVGAAGADLNAVHIFTDTSNLKVEVINNNAIKCYFEINLFNK